MKRLAVLAAVAAACVLSACAVDARTRTPAAIAADLTRQVGQACAVVQPTIATLQAQPAQLTDDQLADLSKAADLAGKVCTMPIITAPTSIADLAQFAVPVVIRIINASPLLPADKAAVSLALNAAQLALSAVLAQ